MAEESRQAKPNDLGGFVSSTKAQHRRAVDLVKDITQTTEENLAAFVESINERREKALKEDSKKGL